MTVSCSDYQYNESAFHGLIICTIILSGGIYVDGLQRSINEEC